MIVSLERAAELLKSGENVAIPTETVYGLAADVFQPEAIKNTFSRKGRPADNPLIVHLAHERDASLVASNIPDDFYMLAERFWPGPLTMILNRRPDVPDVAVAGMNSVAVRVPNHAVTLELIRLTGPLTAPSANRSGRPSPTCAQHVLEDFEGLLPVLDGGVSIIGVESTVLDLTSQPYTVLRPGVIGIRELEEVLGVRISSSTTGSQTSKKSPGTRYRHYAPKARVRWLRVDEKPDLGRTDSLYVFHTAEMGLVWSSSEDIQLTDAQAASGEPYLVNDRVLQFSGDYRAFAANLYEIYRSADRTGCEEIVIEPFKDSHPPKELPTILALANRILHAMRNS